VSDQYTVRIIRRSFYMTNDDWHATVTRDRDGKQLIFIAAFLWLLKWRVRRSALERAFKSSDSYERKIAEVREYVA
jgi:hypothetical protein